MEKVVTNNFFKGEELIYFMNLPNPANDKEYNPVIVKENNPEQIDFLYNYPLVRLKKGTRLFLTEENKIKIYRTMAYPKSSSFVLKKDLYILYYNPGKTMNVALKIYDNDYIPQDIGKLYKRTRRSLKNRKILLHFGAEYSKYVMKNYNNLKKEFMQKNILNEKKAEENDTGEEKVEENDTEEEKVEENDTEEEKVEENDTGEEKVEDAEFDEKVEDAEFDEKVEDAEFDEKEFYQYHLEINKNEIENEREEYNKIFEKQLPFDEFCEIKRKDFVKTKYVTVPYWYQKKYPELIGHISHKIDELNFNGCFIVDEDKIYLNPKIETFLKQV